MIEGAGTATISITGVEEIRPISHRVMPDRIEAGTYMVAAAITKGELTIVDAPLEHLTSVVAKLKEAGVRFQKTARGLVVRRPARAQAGERDHRPLPPASPPTCRPSSWPL